MPDEPTRHLEESDSDGPSPDPPASLDTISTYRVLRTLGEGGMGVVYEAEQTSPRRVVALKVVRGRHVSDHQIRLFQREADALGRLKHPCIGAIYEAGRTDAGEHFFAMELIRGLPLMKYLDREKPSLRRRLGLFLKICEAIHYAHQRGVMHRDIKPSNILVTADGTPKILDFGLARITDTDVTVTTTVSEVGQIQGTLTYMSPEQARGNPDEIDLRSDIYSLGVILFEMLTGKLPYEVHAHALHQAVITICEQPPRRPSQLERGLRGDLETVTVKALEKDPSRRYQSVAALADDVQRYLENQPILARPPSAIYQFRKLVARHKAPFAFVAALFVLIAGFAITMGLMYTRADREATKARQIHEFLQDLLSSADPFREGTARYDLTVRDVLDEAAQRMERELAGHPAVESAIDHTIGETYRNLSLYDAAEPHLRRSLATRVKLHGDDHQDVAQTLSDLGLLLLDKNRSDEAESSFRRALAIAERTVGRESKLAAEIMTNLALALDRQGNYAESEQLYRQALAINETKLGGRHLNIAVNLNNLARTLQAQGKFAEAERAFRRSLDLRRDLFGPDHPWVANGMQTLASMLQDLGRYAEAESLYRETLALYRKSLGEDHLHVATSQHDLASLLREQGKAAEAEPLCRQALEIYRQRLGDEHPHVAACLSNLAEILLARGNYAAADALARRALEIFRRTVDADHPRIAVILHTRGDIKVASGDLEGAEPMLTQALDILRERLGDQHPRVAKCLGSLAKLQLARGDLVNAERRAREALELRRTALPTGHPHIACSMLTLGTVLTERGDDEALQAAEDTLRQALEICGAGLTPDHPLNGCIESTLGACLTAQERYDEAELLLLAACEKLGTRTADMRLQIRTAHQRMVDLYVAWNRPDQAAEWRAKLPK